MLRAEVHVEDPTPNLGDNTSRIFPGYSAPHLCDKKVRVFIIADAMYLCVVVEVNVVDIAVGRESSVFAASDGNIQPKS